MPCAELPPIRADSVLQVGNRIVQHVTLEESIGLAEQWVVPGERRILGITGAPGAGKSTLAERIVGELGPERAILVPMDGFHLSNNVLAQTNRRRRKGAHDTFDDGGYARLLGALRGQGVGDPVVYAPEFRREIEESIGSAIAVASTVPLVVTEGNYLLLDAGAWPVARSLVDEVWFLASDNGIRQERLVRRHQQFGKSAEEANAWALGSDERNAELVESTAVRADRIIRLR